MHDHVSKVLQWGLDAECRPVVTLWGCLECDSISFTPWPVNETPTPHDGHAQYTEGCFACKAKTLQLNAGDAGRPMSDRKWTGELDAYKRARAQGIQPATTRTKDIVAAERASEMLGRAYDGTVMPPAGNITKQHAEAMSEVGI